MLKYDTSHGRFAWDVRQEREQLFVGDDAIRLLHEPTIAALPWRELAVDVVLDCTGVYGVVNTAKPICRLARRKCSSPILAATISDATVA